MRGPSFHLVASLLSCPLYYPNYILPLHQVYLVSPYVDIANFICGCFVAPFLIINIVKELKRSRNAETSAPGPSRVHVHSVPRGPLAPWGSMYKFMGDSNICDINRKDQIEKQIIRMILRMGLPLGFAENKHFQELVELLCPAYAKSGNAFPGDN